MTSKRSYIDVRNSNRCKQCSRLDLMAAVLCCSFHQTAIQSFSWGQTPIKLLQIGINRKPRLHSDQLNRRANDDFFSNRQGMIHRHQCNSALLAANQRGYHDDPSKNVKVEKGQSRTRKSFSTFSTAVCIVPPDEAWDSIQRARHLARDTSFYKVSFESWCFYINDMRV